MPKDILGNDIEPEDLDAFETEQDEPEPPEPSGKTVTVEGPEPINDALIRDVEDGKEIELDTDGGRTPRQQKRQDRWEQHKERTTKAEQARIEAEKQLAVAQRENELLRQMSQQRQQAPAAPETDEETELYEEQARLYDLYNRKAEAGNVTADETRDFQRRVRDLNNKLIDARVSKRLSSQPQNNVGEQAMQAQLQMQYPEVYNDPRAKTYAQGLFMQKVSTGSPNSMETVRQALNETAKRFNYSGVAPVDDATKRRYTGTARGSSGKTVAQPKITVTKEMLKVANATYPHIPDEKTRLKKWLEIHGKKYAENMRED